MSYKRKQPQKTCVICGRTFIASHATLNICSPECSLIKKRKQRRESAMRKRAHVQVKKRKCTECGNIYVSNVAKKLTCSKKCQRERMLRLWREKHPMHRCIVCGKEIEYRKTKSMLCSAECRKSHVNMRRAGAGYNLHCVVCGHPTFSLFSWTKTCGSPACKDQYERMRSLRTYDPTRRRERYRKQTKSNSDMTIFAELQKLNKKVNTNDH